LQAGDKEEETEEDEAEEEEEEEEEEEDECPGKVIVYVEIQRSSSEGVVELPVNQILVSKKAIHGSTL
jgi:hypothetical protein